jgi:hypothetical protein
MMALAASRLKRLQVRVRSSEGLSLAPAAEATQRAVNWCGVEESNLLRSLLAEHHVFKHINLSFGLEFSLTRVPQERNSAPNTCHDLNQDSE